MPEIYRISRWDAFVTNRLKKINGLQMDKEGARTLYITISEMLDWAKNEQMEAAQVLLANNGKPLIKMFVGLNIPRDHLPNEIRRIVACTDGDTFKFSSPPAAAGQLFGRQRA